MTGQSIAEAAAAKERATGSAHRVPAAQVYTPGARPPKREPKFGAGRNAVVIVASTSCAAGEAEDTAGPVAVTWLRKLGYDCPDPVIVADGEPVGRALDHYLTALAWNDRPRIILTSGGTGLNPDDATPQLTTLRVDYEVPGIMHAIWEYGLKKLDYAVMSRGVAGVRDRTFVVNLPGSRGGVRDGITVLDTLIHHVQAQIEDLRDHPDERRQPVGARPAAAGAPPATAGSLSAGAPASASQQAAAAAAASGSVHGMSAGRSAGPSEGSLRMEGPASDGGTVVHTDITEGPLDAAQAEAAVVTDQTGASVVFNGIIRNHDSGRSGVMSLDYTAHPDAAQVLARVVETVASGFPEVRFWAAHRTGRLQVGESALVVAVASAHRGEAFASASALVDAIKDEVPIWKQQFYDDGAHDWSGLE